MIRNFFALGILLFFCSSAGADEIYFKNGDKLSGEIKSLTEGKLVINSSIAGDIKVDISDISTFSSDKPVEIHFKDGIIIKQQVNRSECGQIRVEKDTLIGPESYELEKVVSINPPGPKPPQWQGSAVVGITATHGNTHIDNRSASFNLQRRGKHNRATFSGDYGRSEQEGVDSGDMEVTEDWWRLKGKYDYFFSKKWYSYGSGRYEKDSIANLDRRLIVGAGGGYQWIESESMNFSAEAGLASLHESYKAQDESESELSLQLGYHFDRWLWEGGKLIFINDTTYFPALDDLSDYYLTTTAELRAGITSSIFANLKMIFDYDSTPASGADKTDVKYILGAGVNF